MTAAAEERWTASYAYVRQDLRRILVLAVVLFGVIIVSPLVF